VPESILKVISDSLAISWPRCAAKNGKEAKEKDKNTDLSGSANRLVISSEALPPVEAMCDLPAKYSG